MVNTFLCGAWMKVGANFSPLVPCLLMCSTVVFLPQRKVLPPMMARDVLIGLLLGILAVVVTVVAGNRWWPRSNDDYLRTHWRPWGYVFVVTMWGLWTWGGYRRWRESQCSETLDPQPPPPPGPAAPALAPRSPGPAAWTSTLPR